MTTPAASGPSVVLKDVTKRYGRVRALDGVSLTVNDGEFVTLLGPSGSGKTTCLQIMAGIARPDGGVIRIGDRDVQRVPMHKRDIGMVFQNYALFPNMTVAGNILYPLRMRRWSKDTALKAMRDALALVRLSGYEDRKPEELSGGQQQRVALARAIVFNPRVLLLDEPLSALDRLLREEMQIELRRIHEATGMATVCVTHDRTEALTLSDRVILLRDGKIVQEGGPQEIYQDPVNLFAAEFLGEVNRFRMTVTTTGTERLYRDEHGNELRGLRADAVADGDVDVVTRVENVVLSARTEPAAGSAASGWRGKVVDVVFLGDADRFLVDCAGVSVVARRGREPGQAAIGRGDDVIVTIPPDSARVFAAT